MNGTDNLDGVVADEKPQHLKYLQEFRTTQCQLFLQHKCTQHRPFTCFNWHFANQRRRRPVIRKDGTFNYNPDVYCPKYNENTGICSDGDDCQFVHRTAGDTERRYHPRYYKTATCVHETDAENHCVKNGPHCAFAHSAKDLRQPVYDAREKAEKASTNSTSNGGVLLDGVLLAAGVSNGSNGLTALKATKSDRHAEKEDKDKEVIVDDLRWNDLQYVLLNYKTELCRKPPRQCRQGYACPMYHNNKDRRRSPRKCKYRSTPCPNVKHGDEWGDPSHCELGDSCAYCHTRTEQQFHAEVYKSTKCNDVLQTSRCPRGPFCAFAHNDQELGMDRTAAVTAEELGTALPPMSAGPYSAAVSVFGSTSQFDLGQTPPGGKISPEGSTSGLSLRSSSMSETLASLESSYVAALQQQQLQQHRNSSGSSQIPSFHRFSSGSSAVSPGLPIRHGSHNPDMAAAVHALSSSWNALSFLSSINQTDGSSVSSGFGGGVPDDNSPPEVIQSLSLSQVASGMSGLWGSNNTANRRAVAIAARQKLGRSMSLNAPLGPLSPRNSAMDFPGSSMNSGIPLLVPNEEPDDFDLTSIDKELLSASSTGQQSVSAADRLGLSSSRMTHDSGDSTDSINGGNMNGSSAVWGTPPNAAAIAAATSTGSLAGSVGNGGGLSAVAAALGGNGLSNGNGDNSVFLPQNQMPLCQGLSLPEASSILQAFGAIHEQQQQQQQQRQQRHYQHQRSVPWPNSNADPSSSLNLGDFSIGGNRNNLDSGNHARMRSLSSCVYPGNYSSPRLSLNLSGDANRSEALDGGDHLLFRQQQGNAESSSEREIARLRQQNARLLVQLKEIGGENAIAGSVSASPDDVDSLACQLIEIRQTLLDNLLTVNGLLLAHMNCSACNSNISAQPSLLFCDATLMPKCAHAFCGRCNNKLLTCPICTTSGDVPSMSSSLNGRINSRATGELRAAATAAAAVALENAARRRHLSAEAGHTNSEELQDSSSIAPLRHQHNHHRLHFHPYQIRQQQPSTDSKSPVKASVVSPVTASNCLPAESSAVRQENSASPKSTSSE